jgi:hypothetical protein
MIFLLGVVFIKFASRRSSIRRAAARVITPTSAPFSPPASTVFNHLDLQQRHIPSALRIIEVLLQDANLVAEIVCGGVGVAKLLGQREDLGILGRTIVSLLVTSPLDFGIKCHGQLVHKLRCTLLGGTPKRWGRGSSSNGCVDGR